MKNFTQYTPIEIVFGRDAEKETGRLAKKWGAKKVLLVYGGGSVVKSGLLAVVEQRLDEEDILMHTLERYFTPVDGNLLTDEIAEGRMRDFTCHKLGHELGG